MPGSKVQAAVVGGLVTGVLSALPIVAAGNLCCCLWVVAGGVVAAYVLQQNQTAPISAADGALIGLMAGVVGAFVQLLLSIPITILVAPMERAVLERLAANGNLPPEFRDYISGVAGRGLRMAITFVFMLFVGSMMSTLGGVLGAAIFKKASPPGVPGTV